mgnify:CR=1 FL=1
MFDYFYYYPFPLFLNPMFSLVLIVILAIITPYIIILANKDKDYKNKKLFIVYEKAINILSFLHTILTLIFIIISILAYRYGLIFLSLIIGGVGIAIIYGICYILEKNNISIVKPNINKISMMKIILYAIAPICLIGLSIFIFNNRDFDINPELSILLIIALVLLSIFLLLYFSAIIINSKLNKIIKNSNEPKTTKKDNDYNI